MITWIERLPANITINMQTMTSQIVELLTQLESFESIA